MGNWYTDDVKYIAGVGEARAKLLDKELGIATVGDLLYHFPFRYIDRTKIYRIAEIGASGQTLVQFRGRVTGVAYAGAGRKRRFTAYVADATGQAELVWFQGIKWIEKRIEVGREYLVFGRPSFFRNELSLVHPEVETVEKALSRRAESGLQGIYSSTERLSSVLGTKGFHTIVSNAWRIAGERIGETLPPEMRRQYGLATLREALYNIHFPQSPEALRQAQYRLKFEELLGVQLNVMARRSERLARNDGFYFARVGESFNTFYREKLPFPLTGAQKRVVREIRQDTVTGCQMNRLLQGDVGSGKTLVALLSMLLAVDNGFQACMMAPTEILARQHYATLTRLLDGLPVQVAILTGASKARERRAALEGVASGEVQLLVGTHALIEDRVRFANLGLVVIDEQHRFGVEQRARMWTKNEQPPHVLVMTATPIPRTLAMTLYGDLDVSVIDELPPGRRPVRTVHYTDAARLRVWGFLRQEIARGRQAYVVYPLIEGRLRGHFVRLSAAGVRRRGGARPHEARGQGGGDAPLQVGRGADTGLDDGYRGGGRRPQCHGDGHRVGRTFRPVAAASAARARGARRRAVVLHPHVGRETLEGGAGAARRDVPDQRRVPPCGARPQTARCGRYRRYAAERYGL